MCFPLIFLFTFLLFVFVSTQTNTLECILASDGSHTFSVFNYQSVYWPVAEDLQLGIDTGSTVTQINVESFSETITTRDGIDVYQLHEGVGNSGLPGRWLFRLDSYDSSNSDAKEMCENYLSENQNNPLELMYVKKCPEQLSSVLSIQFYPCSFESLEDQDLINFGKKDFYLVLYRYSNIFFLVVWL